MAQWYSTHHHMGWEPDRLPARDLVIEDGVGRWLGTSFSESFFEIISVLFVRKIQMKESLAYCSTYCFCPSRAAVVFPCLT